MSPFIEWRRGLFSRVAVSPEKTAIKGRWLVWTN